MSILFVFIEHILLPTNEQYYQLVYTDETVDRRDRTPHGLRIACADGRIFQTREIFALVKIAKTSWNRYKSSAAPHTCTHTNERDRSPLPLLKYVPVCALIRILLKRTTHECRGSLWKRLESFWTTCFYLRP